MSRTRLALAGPVLALLALDVPTAEAQANAANYVFSTTTTGSLTDMSTGTTQLVAANQDDTASAVTLIGFDFVYMGVRQDRFSVNSNGLLRFGSTVVQTAAPYKPLGQAGIPLVAPYGADQRTHTTGKVHYKVTGSAPNRVLVIEWLNMQSNFNTGGTVDLTYQLRLSETTGQIEFVYGSMTMSALGAADVNSRDPNIGFSTSNVAGTVGSVTAPQSGVPAPTFDGTLAAPVANLYVAGPITVLTSATQGSRRTFLFTPPTPTAASGLNFTAVTPISMTLNWTDSPNEVAYLIYASTDGGTTFSFFGSAAQNAVTFPAAGLTPSTTYTWNVAAASEGVLASLIGSQATLPPGNVTSAGSGLWSNPATWGGAVPVASDNVTIAAGHTVTIDTAAVAFSVTAQGTATLEFESTTARTLTVGTDVIVQSGGLLQSNAAGTVTTHVLSLAGNLTVDGTLDFSTNADTAGAGITFTGAVSKSLSGAGSVDVRTITINKGTSSASVLELMPAAFTVQGVTTNVAGFLTLTNGTLKISGSFTGTNRVFPSATYTIPATTGIWLNNPNYTVSGQAGATTTVNNGLFRVSQGTYNIGVGVADGMGGGAGAVFIVEGGTVNASGRIDPQSAGVSYTQTGGTVNVGVVGNTRSAFGSFELFSAASSFTMSGGTINLINHSTAAPTPLDIDIRSGTFSVTGGQVVFGGAGAPAGTVYIDNAGLLPTFTVNPTMTLNVTGAVFLRGTTVVNNGAITGLVAAARFDFAGNAPMSYSGAGAFGTAGTPFAGVGISSNSLSLITLSAPIFVNRVNLFQGGFVNSNLITLGNAGASTTVVQIGSTGLTTPGGNFDVSPVHNQGTGGEIVLYAFETAPRTTGVEVNPTRALARMTVDNPSNLTVSGGDLTLTSALASPNHALTLTNGRVLTGANTVYVSSGAGVVTRVTGYVDGNLKKAFTAAGTKTFEVGTANGFSPVVANVTAGTFPADFTVAAVQSTLPGIFPVDKALTRYWRLTAAGVTADLTFTYLDPADIPGTVTEANLHVYRQDLATFTDLGGTINVGANTGQVLGVTTFSNWTLAEAGETAATDLQITKTDGVSDATPGGNVSYTITASNAGPFDTTGTVGDVFPGSLTCSWTCVGAAGGICSGAGAGNISDPVTLPVGGSATYTASCTIAASATGSLANTATVAGALPDLAPGNNNATDTDTLVPSADAAITKTDGVTSVTPGGSTTYTIVASNPGPSDTAATVADTFPGALTCTWTCAGAGGGTCTGAGAGNINDNVSLPAGGSVTYTVPCSVSPSASGTIANTATVTGVANDPNGANNSATDSDTVNVPAAPYDFLKEVEPNNTAATATPLGGPQAKVLANVFPAADVDFFSFTAAAGDQVYAAAQTQFDASGSGDSVLELLDTDGTTILETDLNDGSFNANSSSIAGKALPAAGTYYLRVRHNTATGMIRPYHLHFRLQSGAPTAEVEPNNTTATATPLPPNGWVSGTITAVSPGESDFFSLNLAAGDSVYLSLDMNPERDAVFWNGRLGFGLFGNPPSNQILLAADGNAGSLADPNSEAHFFTVSTAGTYYVYVDSVVAAGLGATATYTLNVSVYGKPTPAGSCTTYTSTDVPKVISAGAPPITVTSTLTIPGNPRIEDLDISINLNHTFMQDLDFHLTSPAGNDNGFLTDVGAGTVGGLQTLMDLTVDDEAGLPQAFALSASYVAQPELAYRLGWFDGEDAGGTWTLTLRDDANTDGGTLNAWSLTVCEPPPPPSCPPGTTLTTVFSTDFEAGDAGFTHSGTADEWERGTPATVATTTANPVAAFLNCNSGTNCWKTDLDNTYDVSSSQNLLSPNINLAGYSAPVTVSWAQRYQMESATFDHMFAQFQQVGGTTPVRLFEHLDATMTSAVGATPTVNIGESSGWARVSRRADSLAGFNSELLFHLDSDTTINFGGLAVDDVQVTACLLPVASADLSITKTDGVTTATPGGSVTYTITASNAGPDGVVGGTVADTFPAILACNWTCVGAGGGTCTAAGAGNINDTVNLPNGASVTYTASCSIAAAATGSLSNTATVSSAVGDPVPGNNSATDTDTLVPSADAAITKTDGVTTATPGGSVTYTITASNSGPSNTTGTVSDTFPASLTCNWTCVGAGGGSCTAAGAGNISDPVTLPAGGSATYTATCNIAASAAGTLSNTATVAGAASDPAPANNSATDTDTLAPSADVSITKTDGLGTATPGTSTVYTITASNAGPSDTTGTVSDTFPATLTCNWTCVGAGGGTCTAAGAGNISDPVTLPAGGSATYTATCNIAASATGTLSNTATVAGAASDPAPANNSATDSDTLTPSADLGVTKIDGPDPIGVHHDLTYTITVSNTGPSDAAGIVLTDPLPAAVSFVSSVPGSPTCTEAAGTVTCNLGGLAASANTVVTIVVQTNTTGTPSNTASVTASTSDPNSANDSAAATTAVKFIKGDLDNDLATDLYIANTLTNEHRVWFMDGVTRLSDLAVNPATPASASQHVAGVADFNSDFRNDLVYWDTASGAVEFWLMDGVNRQGAPVPLSGGSTLAPNWKLSATADFNNDGKPDIVWRNTISQLIVIWTMNGTAKLGNITPNPNLAVNFNWEIVAAQDLNGDGNTDFLWYNSTSGKIVYWWMDASVVRITGNFTNPANAGANNWKVLAGGDYGVGLGGVADSNDIVWRNATSGNFVVWYMDLAGNRTDGVFTSPVAPAGTPTDWVIVGPR